MVSGLLSVVAAQTPPPPSVDVGVLALITSRHAGVRSAPEGSVRQENDDDDDNGDDDSAKRLVLVSTKCRLLVCRCVVMCSVATPPSVTRPCAVPCFSWLSRLMAVSLSQTAQAVITNLQQQVATEKIDKIVSAGAGAGSLEENEEGRQEKLGE